MEIVFAILIGCLAGMVMGLVGVGGGAIIIFSLLYFLHFPQKTAQGTTLFIVAAPISLLAAYKYYKNGLVDIKIGIVIMISFLVFSLIGSHLAMNISRDTLKHLLGYVIILMGFKMVLS